MKIDLQKIAETLDAYQAKYGSVSERSHENVNSCAACYSYASTCSGTCRGGCMGSCNSY